MKKAGSAKRSGEKLRALREERGETVSEVANAVGVVESSITNYESGYRVPKDSVKKRLADYYGVSLEWLFYGSEPRQEEENAVRPAHAKTILRELEINLDETERGVKITILFKTR